MKPEENRVISVTDLLAASGTVMSVANVKDLKVYLRLIKQNHEGVWGVEI